MLVEDTDVDTLMVVAIDANVGTLTCDETTCDAEEIDATTAAVVDATSVSSPQS